MSGKPTELAAQGFQIEKNKRFSSIICLSHILKGTAASDTLRVSLQIKGDPSCVSPKYERKKGLTLCVRELLLTCFILNMYYISDLLHLLLAQIRLCTKSVSYALW